MRETVTRAGLSDILTAELQTIEDAAGSRITVQYELLEPDADGCNWSDSVSVRVGPKASPEYLRPIVSDIIKRARSRYNISG